MTYMAGLQDNAFDLAIVDPPYGIMQDGRKNHTRGNLARAKNYSLNVRYDSGIPEENYFTKLFRVSKNQIIWGGNYYLDYLTATSCFIVWDKNNGANDFADCELAWTSFETATRLFKYTWNGMLQHNMKTKEIRIHPNQKPVQLYKWLLHNYAEPGQTILDTHGGSRSLAIACHEMGFDHVSCELDSQYHADSVKRFNEQTMQQSLFK